MKLCRSLRLPLALSGALFSSLVVYAEHPLEISSYTDANSCLQCHQWADDMMDTIHWTWEHTDTHTGQQLGKKNVINNYCVAVSSNEARCTSCHIGVGWRDDSFDFEDKSQLDCLVCHDTTGTYKKTPTGAGAPDPTVDLLFVANSAGIPDRENCGTCHFYGGGGDAVKHGDLDSTMANPSADLDVHMGGLGFTCITCHAPEAAKNQSHDPIVGTRYSTDSPDHMLCQSCHTATPEEHSGILNMHTSTVACQTCHIPTFARGGLATKMSWDWSTAGEKNPDGSDKVIKDADGNPLYHTKKGTFEWAKDVVPEYVWFNGTVTYATLDDPIAPGQRLRINQLSGDVDDTSARIFPVKRFVGKQPYDAGVQRLTVPHLFPSGPEDTTALWKVYDWDLALEAGQASVGRSYTGPVGWVETEMYWIQNHMVAPKEQALRCTDCHVLGGRIDFAQLGYPAETAKTLQLSMQSNFWAGYPVHTDGVSCDTGDWLGWLYVEYEPWVYSFKLKSWMYVNQPELIQGTNGSWIYLAR